MKRGMVVYMPKKIVFRFSHDGNEASNIVIDGFPTNNHNVEYTGEILSLKPAFVLLLET
jgi:hypothetical protein